MYAVSIVNVSLVCHCAVLKQDAGFECFLLEFYKCFLKKCSDE